MLSIIIFTLCFQFFAGAEAKTLRKLQTPCVNAPDSTAPFAVPILNKDPTKTQTCKKLLKKKKNVLKNTIIEIIQ